MHTKHKFSTIHFNNGLSLDHVWIELRLAKIVFNIPELKPAFKVQNHLIKNKLEAILG